MIKKKCFINFIECVFLSLIFVSCSTSTSRERFDVSDFNAKAGSSGLFEAPANEDVNGFLPDEVLIKTRTQSFCVGYQFCLVDGRVYYKRLPPEGSSEKWRLLSKTGLPHSTVINFQAPKRIIEISADADALFALSDSGRLYRCYFDAKTASPSLTWTDAFGWPDVSPLELNDLVSGNRGWSLGARRNHVLWYDDPSGNQHHFGTMGIETLYFLRSDGQELRYADTGLPSDFSHGLLGPERGAFVARAISASASTVFLMNDSGEMYTRLADFDTLGCDPMFFKYTYRKESYGLDGSDFKSNFTPWALPNESWRKQPSIPASGAARLTSRITILQTGQGNGARELRVAGISPAGETGFYFKRIFDPEWSFRAAALDLFPADFLDQEKTAKGEGSRGERQEGRYSGSLYSGSARVKGLSFEIPDFPMKEGDCRLIVRSGNESIVIGLYPVELWTYQKRYDPGKDGTPRLFHVTLRLPEGGFAGLSPEFGSKLEGLFGGLDLVLFSCRLEAMDSYLYLELGKDPAEQADPDNPDYLFLTRPGAPAIDKELARRSAGYSDRLVGKYLDPDLDIRTAGSLTIANRSKIEKVIELNAAYREELQNELELFRAYRTSSGLSRWGYGAVDLLTSVTFLNQIDFPKIKTMTSYGGKIMEANERTYRNMADSREWVYAKLLELLDLRLAEYGKVIAAFDDDELGAELAPRYRESFLEYYRLLGLPEALDGVNPIQRGKRASVRLMGEMPLFPGLLLTSDNPKKKDHGAKTILLVELKDSARDIFTMDRQATTAKPFRSKVEFHVVSVDGGFGDAKGDRKGSLEWDGRTLRIWRDGQFFMKDLIFRGKAKTDG
jgi:hypothetical protein